MKKYYLHILASFCTILFLSFSSAKNNSSSFACTWFLFDKGVAAPSNFPIDLTEATTPSNYEEVTQTQAEAVCTGVRKICAICAEKDPSTGQPKLGPTEVIVVNHLVPYFNQTNESLRIPNTQFIKEKFTF